MSDIAIETQVYAMNAGQLPPNACIEGGRHSWTALQRQDYGRSGWNIDGCEKCGIRREYDTSD